MLAGYDHFWREGASKDAPTLVMFHGTGSSKEDIAGLADHFAPGAAILAMDGDVMEGPMRRFFRRTGEGVYDMADLAARTGKMAGFLDVAFAEYGLDESAIGVGYSNGANILANLALTGQGPLKRMALLHPLIPFEPAWPDLSGFDVLVTAGKRDPICPWPLTQGLVDGLKGAGATVSLTAHEGGHELRVDEVEALKRFV